MEFINPRFPKEHIFVSPKEQAVKRKSKFKNLKAICKKFLRKQEPAPDIPLRLIIITRLERQSTQARKEK